jgi:hypothetical protein
VSATGAGDDEVGSDLVGEVDDLLARCPLAHGGGDVETLIYPVRGCTDRRERTLTTLGECGAVLVTHCCGCGRDFVVVDDVQRVDRRIEALGHLDRDVDGATDAVGAVRSDHDRVEHTRRFVDADVKMGRYPVVTAELLCGGARLSRSPEANS